MQAKKWGALLLTLVIAAGGIVSLPTKGEANAGKSDKGILLTEEAPTIQGSRLTLTYRPAEDRLSVQDKVTGSLWESMPSAVEDDAVAQGSIRKEMQSTLIVRYIDSKNNNFVANSQTSSISRSTVSVYKKGDGLRVDYDFSRNKERFIIPVVYSVKEDRFTAEILFNEIEEYGDTKICEIKLLPYFGAGRTGEEGFLFVPDGSGAIVDFQDTRSWASSYAKQIYGRDPAKSDYAYSSSEEQIYMPVYGICKKENAFLAVIAQGDANASIEAVQAGNSSEYASIAPVFSYRLLDQMKLQDKYGTEKSITFESRRTVQENPLVQFLFTSSVSADLAEMAGLYRTYLMEECDLQRIKPDQAKSLFLDVYGVSQKKESFLGFLVDRPATGTTVEELRAITERLEQEGAQDSVFSLYYFHKKGTGSGVVRDFSLDSSIGSEKEFRRFAQESAEKGHEFFFAVDNVRIRRSSWGWWSFNSAATNLLQTKLTEYEYKINIRTINKKNPLWFYLRPGKLSATLKDMAYDSIREAGFQGLVLQQTGTVLYSDNKLEGYSDRGMTRDAYLAWFEKAQEKQMPLLADGANVYALPSAQYVTHLPVASANFDICTRAVPFYQMVFHGLKPLASTPLNEEADSRSQFLHCLLTGTGLTYSLTGKSAVVFKDTMLDTLLSTYYLDWADEIGANLRDYTAVHDTLADRFIIGYTVQGTVEEIVYEGGTAVAINTGAEPQVFDGREIPASGYCVYAKQE